MSTSTPVVAEDDFIASLEEESSLSSFSDATTVASQDSVEASQDLVVPDPSLSCQTTQPTQISNPPQLWKPRQKIQKTLDEDTRKQRQREYKQLWRARQKAKRDIQPTKIPSSLKKCKMTQKVLTPEEDEKRKQQHREYKQIWRAQQKAKREEQVNHKAVVSNTGISTQKLKSALHDASLARIETVDMAKRRWDLMIAEREQALALSKKVELRERELATRAREIEVQKARFAFHAHVYDWAKANLEHSNPSLFQITMQRLEQEILQ